MPLYKTLWHGHPLCQVACSCRSTQEWSWSLLAIDKDLCASYQKKNWQLQSTTAPHSFEQLWSFNQRNQTSSFRAQQCPKPKMKKLPSPSHAAEEKMSEFNIDYKLFASFVAISNVIFHNRKLLPNNKSSTILNQNLKQKKTENLLPPKKISTPLESQASVFFQYLPVHQRFVAPMHFLSPGTMRRLSPWLRLWKFSSPPFFFVALRCARFG